MSTNFKAAQSFDGQVDGTGMRLAVVCGRFNDLITNRLLDGALAGLAIHGVSESDVHVIGLISDTHGLLRQQVVEPLSQPPSPRREPLPHAAQRPG